MFMDKNNIFQYGNENRKYIRNDRILWWMKKDRNSIYVSFVNGTHVV